MHHSICKDHGVQNNQRDMASHKYSITQDALLLVYMASVSLDLTPVIVRTGCIMLHIAFIQTLV